MSDLHVVQEHFPLSVPHATIDQKDTTQESTPGGAATPHARGLADTKGHDRLMHIVEPTTDTPSTPACPNCGRPAGPTQTTSSDGITTANYLCLEGHLYSMRWLTDGAA